MAKPNLEAIVDAAVTGGSPGDVGLAIAVVNGTQSLLTKAYGNRIQATDGATSAATTIQTRFALGSSTKPFTSFLLARVAESGGPSLQKPIRDIDQTFAVMNPHAAGEMTLEDVLCQRTGIPRHDAMWYVAQWSPDEVWDRLAFLDPNPDFRYQFRRGFQYNNNLYTMAALAVSRSTSTPWMDHLRQQVLAPLAISHLSSGNTIGNGDVAHPYLYVQGQVFDVPFKDVTHIAPAGGLNGSAVDLVPWLRMLLAEGVAGDGTVLLSKGAFRDLIQSRLQTHGTPTQGYGLGWYLESVGGHRLAFHTGNTDGYSAWMGFLPDDGFALVVLSNEHAFPGGPPPLATRVAITAVRHLLGLPAAPSAPPAPLPNPGGGASGTPAPADAAFLAKRGGTYQHPAYGDIEVIDHNGSLALQYRGHTWELESRPGGGFAFQLYAFGARYPVMPLFLDEGGEPVLALPLEPRVGWTRFRRP